MGDLVVGQGQDEIFVEGVEHGKGELVLVKAPVDGIFAEVVQGIVHPAHIPFKGEPKPSGVDRP